MADTFTDPLTGEAAFTGQAPIRVEHSFTDPLTGEAAFTGQAPIRVENFIRQPGAGTARFTGQRATTIHRWGVEGETWNQGFDIYPGTAASNWIDYMSQASPWGHAYWQSLSRGLNISVYDNTTEGLVWDGLEDWPSTEEPIPSVVWGVIGK